MNSDTPTPRTDACEFHIRSFEALARTPERELSEAKQEHECTNCPECHCEKYTHANYLGKGFRVCAHCQQEWWTDINYGKIDLHTKSLKADRDRWREMARELAAHLKRVQHVNRVDQAKRWDELESVPTRYDETLSRFNAMNKEQP